MAVPEHNKNKKIIRQQLHRGTADRQHVDPITIDEEKKC